MADNVQRSEDEQKKQKLEEETNELAKSSKKAILFDAFAPMCSSDEDDYSDDEQRTKDMELYCKQVQESGGYDVGYFPKFIPLGGFMITPVSKCPEKSKELKGLSEFAIQCYNEKHGTKYKLSKVVNGTIQPAFMYYLTFRAKEEEEADDDEDKTFRAKVFEPYIPQNGVINEFISCDIFHG